MASGEIKARQVWTYLATRHSALATHCAHLSLTYIPLALNRRRARAGNDGHQFGGFHWLADMRVKPGRERLHAIFRVEHVPSTPLRGCAAQIVFE